MKRFFLLLLAAACLTGHAAPPTLDVARRAWLDLPDEPRGREVFLQAATAETDRAVLAWAAVMLSLDDLAHARGAEATKWKQQAESLAPDTRILLALDVRELTRNCARCEGKGKLQIKCPTCDGSGQCRACNGRGTMEALQRRKGKGPRDSQPCPACRGARRCPKCVRGKIEHSCAGCGGSGREIWQARAARRWTRLMKAGINVIPGTWDPEP